MQSEVHNCAFHGTSLQFVVAEVYLKACGLTAIPNDIKSKNELAALMSHLGVCVCVCVCVRARARARARVLEDGRSEDKEKICFSKLRKFPTIQLYFKRLHL